MPINIITMAAKPEKFMRNFNHLMANVAKVTRQHNHQIFPMEPAKGEGLTLSLTFDKQLLCLLFNLSEVKLPVLTCEEFFLHFDPVHVIKRSDCTF